MHLSCSSPGVSAFQSIHQSFDRTLHRSGFERFQRADFEPFWRLGFSVWDREKLARLGLSNVPHFAKQREPRWVGLVRNGSGAFEFYFRWKSLMVEKDKNDTGA